jgi:hypothetical protein
LLNCDWFLFLLSKVEILLFLLAALTLQQEGSYGMHPCSVAVPIACRVRLICVRCVAGDGSLVDVGLSIILIIISLAGTQTALTPRASSRSINSIHSPPASALFVLCLCASLCAVLLQSKADKAGGGGSRKGSGKSAPGDDAEADEEAGDRKPEEDDAPVSPRMQNLRSIRSGGGGGGGGNDNESADAGPSSPSGGGKAKLKGKGKGKAKAKASEEADVELSEISS